MQSIVRQEETGQRLTFGQQPREANKAFAAFKTYLELVAERSLVLAADKVGESKRMEKKA